jgi:hypothetical protein
MDPIHLVLVLLIWLGALSGIVLIAWLCAFLVGGAADVNRGER